MNYSLKQLKVFVTVAQEKSFSRAGERIGLSQSAVSHSVKELENHTGVRLLDRTTREVVLTDAGQQLLLRLERLLDELNSTLRDTGRMGQQLSGKFGSLPAKTISGASYRENALLKAIAAIQIFSLSCTIVRSSG